MIKSEIEINIEKPFLNDKLDREKIADVLTKIIDGNSGNFVLSVESRWGTGKTTFFKMWKQKLDNTDKYKTIYFNAWENDDSEDPLLAILSEMESIFEKSKYDKIKKSIVPLLKQAFPVAIKILSQGVLDFTQQSSFSKEQFRDLAGVIAESQFTKYTEEKAAKEKFKKELIEFQKKENKKIVVFIDELDRCRPTFAIETLERIKHLFSLDNYIFILGIDKEQLSHSIATIYGQNMDSIGYLRRFIDFEYNLPQPNREVYFDFLKNKLTLIPSQDNIELLNLIRKMVSIFNLSLRDLEKLFYYIELYIQLRRNIYSEFKNRNKFNFITVFLLILKVKESIIYKKFLNKERIIDEVQNYIGLINKVKEFREEEMYKLIHDTINFNCQATEKIEYNYKEELEYLIIRLELMENFEIKL